MVRCLEFTNQACIICLVPMEWHCDSIPAREIVLCWGGLPALLPLVLGSCGADIPQARGPRLVGDLLGSPCRPCAHL